MAYERDSVNNKANNFLCFFQYDKKQFMNYLWDTFIEYSFLYNLSMTKNWTELSSNKELKNKVIQSDVLKYLPSYDVTWLVEMQHNLVLSLWSEISKSAITKYPVIKHHAAH